MRIINFNLFPTLKAENISQPEKYLWPATKIKSLFWAEVAKALD